MPGIQGLSSYAGCKNVSSQGHELGVFLWNGSIVCEQELIVHGVNRRVLKGSLNVCERHGCSCSLQLQTYMVWIPEDQTSSCSLPPVPQRRIDRTPPSRKCNSRMNGNFGQFIGLNQTTYQEEISQTPFRHRPGKELFSKRSVFVSKLI